jgi:c-di-GMP-binding flagellar brake protein YcgR
MPDNSFETSSDQWNLKPEESRLLFQAATNAGIDPPDAVFYRRVYFEQCIHNEIERIKNQNVEKFLECKDALTFQMIRRKLAYDKLGPLEPLISSRMIETGAEGNVHDLNQRVLVQRSRVVFKSEIIFRLNNSDAVLPRDIPFKAGQTLLFTVPRKDGMYFFTVNLFSASNDSVDFFHSMTYEKRQVRKNVRIDVDLPIRIILNAPQALKSKKQAMRTLTGKMLDISGGGACFVADELLSAGDSIRVDFVLNDVAYKNISAKIIRSYKMKEGGSNCHFRSHMEFIDFDERQREQIIRHIFEQNRIMANIVKNTKRM